jgi:hypothetical protein
MISAGNSFLNQTKLFIFVEQFMPKPETVSRLLNLAIKPLNSNFNRAFRNPTFPFTREPHEQQNTIITPNTPVQLAHYKSIYQSPKTFYGLTKKLMQGTVYPKRKYSSMVNGRISNKHLFNYARRQFSVQSITFKENRLLQSFKQYFNEDGYEAKRCVGHFLVLGGVLVCGIIALGGLTRLTESGLSMVDWSLIHFKPPQNDVEWAAYFEKYKQFPEFQLLNRDMTLEEFKFIYYMEFAHRVYGRCLGLFFFGGSMIFMARNMVTRPVRNTLHLINALILGQVKISRSAYSGSTWLVHG